METAEVKAPAIKVKKAKPQASTAAYTLVVQGDGLTLTPGVELEQALVSVKSTDKDWAIFNANGARIIARTNGNISL